MTTICPNALKGNPDLPVTIQQRIRHDFERCARFGLPNPLEPYILENYQLDLATTYAGIPLKNPWGKASGQLSMNPQQVAEDAAAGLGFCVLKTVIAQDEAGRQTMRAWAVPETRMVVQRIRGDTGEDGWTVNWKGRGWPGSFDEYLQLLGAATQTARPYGMLVVPSCKYHLRSATESGWKVGEYDYTTPRLLDAATLTGSGTAVAIEKDFSPTLAGSDLAGARETIMDWLQRVPFLIRQSAGRPVRVVIKLFNALFDDEFQIQMLRLLADAHDHAPDAVVYANRLFEPEREFEGHRGIAVGGPSLSQRNLRVLTQFQAWRRAQPQPAQPIELSATGDISYGKTAVEYLLAGCRSFQMHTVFQLPASEYTMRRGTRSQKVLHRLLFDPQHGFIAWALHAAQRLAIHTKPPIRITDLADRRTEYLAAN